LALTVNQRIKIKIIWQFVVAGIILGILYIFIEHRFSAQLHNYRNGVAVGIILGLMIPILELSVFSRGAMRLKFIWLLIFRTGLYLVLITLIIFNVVVYGTYINKQGLGYIETMGDPDFHAYLFGGPFLTAVLTTLVFSFSVNFIRTISRKMGQGMLVSYIRGTYYLPVHQARIIMFINVIASKKIAHDLGPKNLQRFLNDIFYDLTDPVVSNQGIIYEYIEDLMVITWSIDKGLRNASCIRAFFDFRESIELHKEKYLNKYGITPHVQASLHTGSVVRAEIGEVKTQIVFHGDTMNTTARILNKGTQLKTDLLASEQLIRMIGLPRIYEKKSVGEISLRGKQEPLKLFEIIDKM